MAKSVDFQNLNIVCDVTTTTPANLKGPHRSWNIWNINKSILDMIILQGKLEYHGIFTIEYLLEMQRNYVLH